MRKTDYLYTITRQVIDRKNEMVEPLKKDVKKLKELKKELQEKLKRNNEIFSKIENKYLSDNRRFDVNIDLLEELGWNYTEKIDRFCSILPDYTALIKEYENIYPSILNLEKKIKNLQQEIGSKEIITIISDDVIKYSFYKAFIKIFDRGEEPQLLVEPSGFKTLPSRDMDVEEVKYHLPKLGEFYNPMLDEITMGVLHCYFTRMDGECVKYFFEMLETQIG